jgi:hypothetical protein
VSHKVGWARKVKRGHIFDGMWTGGFSRRREIWRLMDERNVQATGQATYSSKTKVMALTKSMEDDLTKLKNGLVGCSGVSDKMVFSPSVAKNGIYNQRLQFRFVMVSCWRITRTCAGVGLVLRYTPCSTTEKRFGTCISVGVEFELDIDYGALIGRVEELRKVYAWASLFAQA